MATSVDIVRKNPAGQSAKRRTTTSHQEHQSNREHRNMPDKGEWILDRGKGKTLLTVPGKHTIFGQGEEADAVFYLRTGKVKLTVVSAQGKEAVVAIVERDGFFGESCLAGYPMRTATATTLEDSTLVRIDKDAMSRTLHEDSAFAGFFLSYLLTHTMRIQENVMAQLFNSSEKRLARVLLSLAHFEHDDKPEIVIPKLSQETFAEMIGTTRSRVSFFMNKFRKLGYIDYSTDICVRSSLANILLHD